MKRKVRYASYIVKLRQLNERDTIDFLESFKKQNREGQDRSMGLKTTKYSFQASLVAKL